MRWTHRSHEASAELSRAEYLSASFTCVLTIRMDPNQYTNHHHDSYSNWHSVTAVVQRDYGTHHKLACVGASGASSKSCLLWPLLWARPGTTPIKHDKRTRPTDW